MCIKQGAVLHIIAFNSERNPPGRVLLLILSQIRKTVHAERFSSAGVSTGKLLQKFIAESRRNLIFRILNEFFRLSEARMDF
jgi:hypothetical protein